MSEPEIPQDHPIREIWKINKLDIDGYIELARDGDNDASMVLLARYASFVQREQRDLKRGVKNVTPGYQEYKAKLEQYMLESIRDTLKTGDANYGFNLSHAEKHRPKLTFREKQRQCHLAYQVAKIVDTAPSKNRAFEIAEVELGVKKSSCRAVYLKYMKISKN